MGFCAPASRARAITAKTMRLKRETDLDMRLLHGHSSDLISGCGLSRLLATIGMQKVVHFAEPIVERGDKCVEGFEACLQSGLVTPLLDHAAHGGPRQIRQAACSNRLAHP